MSKQKTKEQERAASAWSVVKTLPNEKQTKEKYGSTVKKMPAMVLTNGLGATLAFLRAKATHKPDKQPTADNKANRLAYEHVSLWVTREIDGTSGKNLLETICDEDSNYYRRATTESLSYLNWLRRFVEAEGLGEE